MIPLQQPGEFIGVVVVVVYLVIVPILLYGIGKNTKRIIEILERIESSEDHELSQSE